MRALPGVGAAELAHLTPNRAARDAQDLTDLLRVLGPLDVDELVARSVEALDIAGVGAALRELEATRQVIPVRIAGTERWAVVEDAARLRDAAALGCDLALVIASPGGGSLANEARAGFRVGYTRALMGLER